MERNERNVRVLERLVELGMELAEAIAQNAKACLEAAGAEGVAPVQDATAPFNKIAQTVRRTIALQDRLGEEVSTCRTDLATQRAERRAELYQTHRQATRVAIEASFFEAVGADLPDRDSDRDSDSDSEEPEGLLRDFEELLYDSDEHKGFEDRQVGETVARLCAALGFDQDLCVLDGDTWKVRREPFAFETRQAKADPPIPPSPAPSLDTAATGPPG